MSTCKTFKKRTSMQVLRPWHHEVIDQTDLLRAAKNRGFLLLSPSKRQGSLGVKFWLQFWADRMRNPQILGILLPRATYWVLPGADAANSGTDSNADMAYHLTLDCIGRQLPFLLDFQGSALILVVRHQFSICICGSQCCLRLLPRQHLCWSALFGTLLQTCRQVSH